MNYKNKNITIRKYTQMIADFKSRFELLMENDEVGVSSAFWFFYIFFERIVCIVFEIINA